MKKTKQERFKRLAEARVNKILAMLKRLGICLFKGNYEYNDEQVKKIFWHLGIELKRTYLCFKDDDAKKNEKFSLSENQKSEPTFPSVYLTLPDGSRLRAEAVDDENFPAVNIWLQTPVDQDEKAVCFVEYNDQRDVGKELCIGVCSSNCEDPYFYESFNSGVFYD